MSAAPFPRYPSEHGYNGLRMTADEFLALGETQEDYELIDGVVFMSPSPFPDHNEIENQIGHQLARFAEGSGKVRIFPETDIRLTSGKVYRPDISAYLADRLKGKVRHLTTPPDLVVQILSPGTKSLDLITKRDDYERFGVGEYWVLDPEDATLRVWRRSGVHLLQAAVDGDRVPCAAIPGFALDLVPIRRMAAGE